jgi:hypothetical protein
LVVFAVGPVRDGIVFGCMHASVFWMSDIWVPASWVNQVILHHKGRRNLEDGGMWDRGGQMNEKMQAKGASRGTKHGASARRDAGCPLGRLGWGNQSPPCVIDVHVVKPVASIASASPAAAAGGL